MKFLLTLLLLTSLLALGQLVDNRDIAFDSQTNIEADKSSAPSAHIVAQVCQTGFSGQLVEGGFSVVNADAFCDLIRLSEVMLNASKVQASMGNQTYADLYMEYYHQALKDANSLVSNTEYSSFISRVADSLLVPLLLLAGLIALL